MRARIKFNLLVRWLFPNLEHASWFNFSIPDVRVVLIEFIKLMSSRLPESKCLRINVLRSLEKLFCVVILCCGLLGYRDEDRWEYAWTEVTWDINC
ncbi:hypothetical protein [Candidatus Hodgkinia cicadicola]|uniref:hypothetical protein n=1 Tax=Candidatus Hodgkinia cicadicola TaxID=573658 RepID=UPI0011BAB2D0